MVLSIFKLREKKKKLKNFEEFLEATKTITMINLKKFLKKNKENTVAFKELLGFFLLILEETTKKNFTSLPPKEEVFLFGKKNNQAQKQKKCLWLIINSNFGFCGDYNSYLNSIVKKKIKKNDQIIAFGNQVTQFFPKEKIVRLENETFNDKEVFNRLNNVSLFLLDYFIKNDFDNCQIVYTDLKPNWNLEVKIIDFFPLSQFFTKCEWKKIIPYELVTINEVKNIEIMNYEPKKEIIFQDCLPFFLNSLFYYLFLRTQFVENFLRKNYVESALENTENLIKENNRFLNNYRQQRITNEIIEIISALEVVVG